ncbi:MAG TPA: hypothetical protein PKJ63_09585 [Cyclobacteriaceae bacterium]|nr:hypothetical protein [Cyclobacteriaceae bacterium]
MKDNLESDQEGLVPSGKRELSTDKSNLYHRGLGLLGNLKKKTCTINFPRDYSIGKLFIYDEDPHPAYRKMLVQELEAQGEISIPEGKYIELYITWDYPYCLSPISQLKPNDLDSLMINHGQVNDFELIHVSRLTKLRNLSLVCCYAITESGFLKLQVLKSLEKLSVYGSLMGDEGLDHLHLLSSLQDLTITNARVSNHGLKSLKKLPSLQKFWISNVIAPFPGSDEKLIKLNQLTNTINDAGLFSLSQLTNLEELSLVGIKISDAGLPHLLKMDSLRSLELTDTEVSNAGLEYLVKLKNLKYLYLYLTSVTEAGIAILKNALPNCSIYHSKRLTHEDSA